MTVPLATSLPAAADAPRVGSPPRSPAIRLASRRTLDRFVYDSDRKLGELAVTAEKTASVQPLAPAQGSRALRPRRYFTATKRMPPSSRFVMRSTKRM
jgi:hypothetical protein